jgi:hypothetical protein
LLEKPLVFLPFLGERIVSDLSFVAEQIIEPRTFLSQRIVGFDAFRQACSHDAEALRGVG